MENARRKLSMSTPRKSAVLGLEHNPSSNGLNVNVDDLDEDSLILAEANSMASPAGHIAGLVEELLQKQIKSPHRRTSSRLSSSFKKTNTEAETQQIPTTAEEEDIEGALPPFPSLTRQKSAEYKALAAGPAALVRQVSSKLEEHGLDVPDPIIIALTRQVSRAVLTNPLQSPRKSHIFTDLVAENGPEPPEDQDEGPEVYEGYHLERATSLKARRSLEIKINKKKKRTSLRLSLGNGTMLAAGLALATPGKGSPRSSGESTGPSRNRDSPSIPVPFPALAQDQSVPDSDPTQERVTEPEIETAREREAKLCELCGIGHGEEDEDDEGHPTGTTAEVCALECGHSYCKVCLTTQLQTRWPSHHVSFAFVTCCFCRHTLSPKAGVELDPQVSSLLTEALELKQRVTKVCVAKLTQDDPKLSRLSMSVRQKLSVVSPQHVPNNPNSPNITRI